MNCKKVRTKKDIKLQLATCESIILIGSKIVGIGYMIRIENYTLYDELAIQIEQNTFIFHAEPCYYLKDYIVRIVTSADCCKDYNLDFLALSETGRRNYSQSLLNRLSGGIDF
jgi:hypothetical protein